MAVFCSVLIGGRSTRRFIMAFAHTLMVFILVVSFGVLATVVLFWLQKGKLVDENPKETWPLDMSRWDATTLLMR